MQPLPLGQGDVDIKALSSMNCTMSRSVQPRTRTTYGANDGGGWSWLQGTAARTTNRLDQEAFPHSASVILARQAIRRLTVIEHPLQSKSLTLEKLPSLEWRPGSSHPLRTRALPHRHRHQRHLRLCSAPSSEKRVDTQCSSSEVVLDVHLPASATVLQTSWYTKWSAASETANT